MRILQISSARTFGGGERHFADLSNALTARGHEVHVALVPASALHDELKLAPTAQRITLPLRNALDVYSATALARFVRAQQIEIVHAHVARDYPLAAYAVRRSNARLIITRHVPFALNRLHRFALANVARVIAVSGPVAEQMRARKIFPAAKIRVVPNGINLARYADIDRATARAELQQRLQTQATLFVGTVGELSPVKGQDVFIRAAASVIERGLTNIAFIVVGTDNAPAGGTRKQLEALSAAHKLEQQVHMLGRVADLARLLPALDAYVSASRAEAFGLATVEAMACGVPVVATTTDGSREIVTDGLTGRLVPVGAHEALAAALIELLNDADLRTKLGAQARAAAHARFSLERMIAETEAIYLEALS